MTTHAMHAGIVQLLEHSKHNNVSMFVNGIIVLVLEITARCLAYRRNNQRGVDLHGQYKIRTAD